MSRSRILAGIAGAMTLVAALIPGIAAAEVPANQVPDDLKAVIEQHIESKGHDYFGFCREANETVPLPAGKYCIFVQSIEHDIAEITYGPVASNDITFVSFEKKDGTWKLRTADQPYNPGTSPTPRPPATGNGGMTGSSDNATGLGLIVVAGSLAAAGAGALALRRR